MVSKLKQSLLDFQSEMKGSLLEDTFTVQGKTWTMRLLNEEEQTWSTSMMNTTNVVTTAVSSRLATLAIGIREIDGVPVYEHFAGDWDNMPEATRTALEDMNKYALKYFVAEHLHSIMAPLPPETITSLWEGWSELIKRREGAQDMSKKSSGETSQEESDES